MIIEIDAYRALANSNFSRNFTCDALNFLADILEDCYYNAECAGSEDIIDTMLMNSTEYASEEEALSEYEFEDWDELERNMTCGKLDNGHVIVCE